jgi:hypothetical protein
MPSSPLTRHLYSLDEVVSALQTSLRSCNGRALFWFWELAVSLEADAALRAALDAWLLWGGGHDPALLTLPAPADLSTAFALMTRVQAAIQTAGSLTAHRLLTTPIPPPPPPSESDAQPQPPLQSLPQRVLPPAPPHEDDPEAAALLWKQLFTSLTAKPPQRRTALHALRTAATDSPLCPDTVWRFLRCLTPATLKPTVTLLSTRATAHTESQLLHQAAAVLIICNSLTAPPSTDTKVPVPTTLRPSALAERDWTAWTAQEGRRGARVQAILPTALHQKTTRGSLSAAYTNIADLRDPVPSLLTGCQFWRAAAAAAGATFDPATDSLQFPTDEALESFYALHFPDDIPDEWSMADQQKSHGAGCAETAPVDPMEEILTTV